ncbi:MAG: DUF2852 domain-containing protein, partial [Clostridiales bacterium]|nr:DUF2852 domain-containing protein [Clostridiales bacterium]
MNEFHNSNRPVPHIPWGLIIVGFIFFWPVGLGLLVYKLATENSNKQQRPNWEEALDDFADDVHVIGDNFKEDFQREFSRTRDAARQNRTSSQPYQRSYSGAASQQEQKTRKKPAKIKDGKLMTALGAVVGVGGLAACLNALAFWLPYYPLYALQDAMAP